MGLAAMTFKSVLWLAVAVSSAPLTDNELQTRLVAIKDSKPELLSLALSSADPDLLRTALTNADPQLLKVALTSASPKLLKTALSLGVRGGPLHWCRQGASDYGSDPGPPGHPGHSSDGGQA